jgi:mevalonate kinase
VKPLFSWRVRVPAKAMLWGEFGVLYGGKAIVATLPHPLFVCEFEVFQRQSADDVVFSIVSDFFPSGKMDLHHAEIANSESSVSSEKRFFFGIAHPFRDVFKNYRVVLRVPTSFAPSLGFGSSSALLAASHRVLCRLRDSSLLEWNSPSFWNGVFESLSLSQGGGSGYDVAVQAASAIFDTETARVSESPRFWIYRKTAALPIVEQIEFPLYQKFGVLVASHVYSQTSKVFVDPSKNELWAQEHAALAERFLSAPESSEELMKCSRELALRQGLWNSQETDFGKVCSELNALGVPWKTMGAGRGDCLWVGATRHALSAGRHPLTGRSLADEIVFDFSSI